MMSQRLSTCLAAALLLAACRATEPLPATRFPVPSLETRTQSAGWGDRTWQQQFEDIRTGARELDPRLVLIGDSITQSWGGGGRQVGGGGGTAREQWLEPLGPLLNAGISGDRTQHVLWRLENGMLDHAAPEVVVLMIGTNNLPHDGAADIAAGVADVLAELARRVPAARIVLVSCPPRGRDPEDPQRQKGADLNRRLEALASKADVDWLDLAPLLLEPSGQARPDRMAGDFVHFSPAGYAAVGEALDGRLRD